MKQRPVIWTAIALAAAAALAFAPPPDNPVVAPTRSATAPGEGLRAPLQAPSASARQELAVLSIRPRESSASGDGPFPVPSRPVQPARVERIAAPAEAASAPQPPPLPFQAVGRFIEDGREVVFLVHGEQTLMAKPGDTLAGSYRVVALDANAITLLYLPLQIEQTLPLAPPP